MLKTFKSTVRLCLASYIVQSIVNAFAPLLYVTFQTTYSVSLSEISLLIAINFLLQLGVDYASSLFVDKIGYRKSIILAHFLAGFGLSLLSILPEIMPNRFLGILISVLFSATGGGLIEVVASPIVEACPTDNKEKTMSILHSFYCWGCAIVIVVSTLFFKFIGILNWKYLNILWVAYIWITGFLYLFVPINSLDDVKQKGMTTKELFKTKIYYLFLLLLLCSGACELCISQWVSVFMEEGLGLNKELGDIVGTLVFAVLMGIVRVFYGKFGDKINLLTFMIFNAILCVISYLMISLFKNTAVNIVGIAFAGLSCSIMWPAMYSISAKIIPNGGTKSFAFLAFAGDLGCALGPSLIGLVSGAFDNNLRLGILVATVFPVVMLIGTLVLKKKTYKTI